MTSVPNFVKSFFDINRWDKGSTVNRTFLFRKFDDVFLITYKKARDKSADDR